ncbi:MAG: hypothetical protein PVG74_16665, partial [Desulfobacterales bacterium]
MAVKNRWIVKIGQLGHYAGSDELDNAGSVGSPGFIDSHSHADSVLFDRDGIMDYARLSKP